MPREIGGGIVWVNLTSDERAWVERLRTAEGCTVANLVRRALTTLAEEAGFDEMVFPDRSAGRPKS